MAWRIAVVTEDGTEKLEMSPEELKAFIIRCAKTFENGDKVAEAVAKAFDMADAYLRQETVKLP